MVVCLLACITLNDAVVSLPYVVREVLQRRSGSSLFMFMMLSRCDDATDELQASAMRPEPHHCEHEQHKTFTWKHWAKLASGSFLKVMNMCLILVGNRKNKYDIHKSANTIQVA